MNGEDSDYDPKLEGQYLTTWSTEELEKHLGLAQYGFALDPTWHVIFMDATVRKDEIEFIRDSIKITMTRHLEIEMQKKSIASGKLWEGRVSFKCRQEKCE